MASFDPELSSFESSSAGGAGGMGSMLVPVLIGVAGVVLGGAALYFSLSGTDEAGAAQQRLESMTAKAEGLETRIRDLEAKYAQMATQASSMDKDIDQVVNDTKTAFRQVGIEINRNREQIDQNADALTELIQTLNRTGRPASAGGAQAAAPAQPAAPVSEESARERLPLATENVEEESEEVVIIADDQVHTIRSGDTFTKLSQQYNVSVAAILAANPDVDPRRLAVGQKITIPAK
ncbi:MAG: LysM peptidoglycan-binding domain-containing protein [Puniceicoccales bacterium]